MKTMTLNKTDIYKGSLILINQQHAYQNKHNLSLINEDGVLLEKKVSTLLHHIFNELKMTNEITLVSGYRTLEEQTQIYENTLRDYGYDFTHKYVALPRHSEHLSGLAIDLACTSEDIDFIRPQFINSDLCNKFKQTAIQYGFIQRYQQDKQSLTKIEEEPWHFRYVGIPHASYIHENQLCLEEYIELIKDYNINNPLYYYFQNRLFTIFYVQLFHESVSLSLKENLVYQVSGNNIDGFIVTGWNPYV